MKRLMAMLKAVSDENRVRLLMALSEGELCVCQLIEFIELAPSTVSKRMSILRGANLVESRKKGRWVYYRLPDSGEDDSIAKFIDWLMYTLADNPRIQGDKARMAEVLESTPMTSCERAPHGK